MSGKRRYQRPGSLQPNIEDILEWSELPEDAFEDASAQEKEDFIKVRKSVSYWADAWRRLRKNKVAMVAFAIIIILVIFAFVGPNLVPYTYKQQTRGAEALHPWHYTLEDQEKIDAYMEEHNEEANMTPDEAIEAARAKAEQEGKTLSRVEEAKIRAKASVKQKSASDEKTMLQKHLESNTKHLDILHRSCRKKQMVRRYSHMYLVQTIRVVILWSELWWEQEFLLSLVSVQHLLY